MKDDCGKRFICKIIGHSPALESLNPLVNSQIYCGVYRCTRCNSRGSADHDNKQGGLRRITKIQWYTFD